MHVAGPVEDYTLGFEQRCLRCDRVLLRTRGKAPWYALGTRVGVIPLRGGRLRYYIADRELSLGERDCKQPV